MFDYAVHTSMAMVFFTEMEWAGDCAVINADCVVRVEKDDEEDALARMREEVALVEAQEDGAIPEKVPRKKAKTIKDYPQD